MCIHKPRCEENSGARGIAKYINWMCSRFHNKRVQLLYVCQTLNLVLVKLMQTQCLQALESLPQVKQQNRLSWAFSAAVLTWLQFCLLISRYLSDMLHCCCWAWVLWIKCSPLLLCTLRTNADDGRLVWFDITWLTSLDSFSHKTDALTTQTGEVVLHTEAYDSYKHQKVNALHEKEIQYG